MSSARALTTHLWSPTGAINLALKTVFVFATLFIWAFPDLPQFAEKIMLPRTFFYPFVAFFFPALYAWRALRGPYPMHADLVVTFVVTFDLVGNIMDMYAIAHFDKVVHGLNGVLLSLLLIAFLRALVQLRAFDMGFRTTLVFAFFIYKAIHWAWETFEWAMDTFFGTNLLPGGMTEATLDTLSSLFGALVAVALIRRWQRDGGFEREFVAPLASFIDGVTRSFRAPPPHSAAR